jgi:hypothetical protein
MVNIAILCNTMEYLATRTAENTDSFVSDGVQRTDPVKFPDTPPMLKEMETC